jgi:hypothetical protein
MEPQVGDIWVSGSRWHVLLLEKLEKADSRTNWFSILFLEDGLISTAAIDQLYWQKVT